MIPDTFDRDIGGNEASFAGDDNVKGRSLVGALDPHVYARSTIGDFRYGYTQFNMSLLPTTLTNPLWKTIPGTADETIRFSLGAHRGHDGLCRIGQRTLDPADPRSEDARSWLPTSPR